MGGPQKANTALDRYGSVNEVCCTVAFVAGPEFFLHHWGQSYWWMAERCLNQKEDMIACNAEPKTFSGLSRLKRIELPKPAVTNEKYFAITAAGVTPLDHTIRPASFTARGPLVLGNEGAAWWRREAEGLSRSAHA